MKKFILLIIGIAFIGIGAALFFNVYNKEMEYKEADENYEALENLFMVEVTEKHTEETMEGQTEKKNSEGIKVFAYNHKKMTAINEDAKGYIILDNSNISYPIVQGTDNSYYLTHDAAKNYSVNGAIFIESTCKDGLNERKCVLYGHHMKNKSMFGDLSKYTNETFALSHQKFTIYNEDEKREYGVISSFITKATDKDIYQIYYSSDEEFDAWIKSAISKSTVKYDINEADISDSFIVLSTCTGVDDNTRHIVVLKQIRK